MKFLIVLTFFFVFNESKGIKTKRGIFNEGLFLGGIHDLSTGVDLSHRIALNYEPYLNHLQLETPKYSYGISSPTIDLGSTIHKHITITNNVGVPVPQPYAVPIVKKIAVPVPHPVAVPVDKPYSVQIPKPYAVPVDKPYPVTVEKAVPYPVGVPVKVPFSVPIAVAIPKPVAVPVHKVVPYAVHEPVKVFQTIPVVKTPVATIGSGSLGYTHLGNGAYALGSGSLGISGHAINSILKPW